MIDLTQPIDVAPIFYEVSVIPSAAASNPKFEHTDPTRDKVARIFHSGQYAVLGLDKKCQEIATLVEKSKDSLEWDDQIEAYNAEAEVYRRLFEAAPKTLALLKELMADGCCECGESPHGTAIESKVAALIAEIERGTK